MSKYKCPAMEEECNHFMYQLNNKEEVVLSHCMHPNNLNAFTGNCTKSYCPHISRNAWLAWAHEGNK